MSLKNLEKTNPRQRGGSTNLAIKVGEYVMNDKGNTAVAVKGEALNGDKRGETVTVSLDEERTYKDRASLDDRRKGRGQMKPSKPGDIMAFESVIPSGNGFKAKTSTGVSHDAVDRPGHVLTGLVRVSPPRKVNENTYRQRAMVIDNTAAISVADSNEVRAAVLQALGEPLGDQGDSAGTPSAVVRGVDSDGNALATIINQAFDPETETWKTPEASFEAWQARERIALSGIDADLSGRKFLDVVDNGEISVEVMPARQVNVNNYNLAQHVEKHGADKGPHQPFLLDKEKSAKATGFKSGFIAVSTSDNDNFFARAVLADTPKAPTRPLAFVPTERFPDLQFTVTADQASAAESDSNTVAAETEAAADEIDAGAMANPDQLDAALGALDEEEAEAAAPGA